MYMLSNDKMIGLMTVFVFVDVQSHAYMGSFWQNTAVSYHVWLLGIEYMCSKVQVFS